MTHFRLIELLIDSHLRRQHARYLLKQPRFHSQWRNALRTACRRWRQFGIALRQRFPWWRDNWALVLLSIFCAVGLIVLASCLSTSFQWPASWEMPPRSDMALALSRWSLLATFTTLIYWLNCFVIPVETKPDEKFTGVLGNQRVMSAFCKVCCGLVVISHAVLIGLGCQHVVWFVVAMVLNVWLTRTAWQCAVLIGVRLVAAGRGARPMVNRATGKIAWIEMSVTLLSVCMLPISGLVLMVPFDQIAPEAEWVLPIGTALILLTQVAAGKLWAVLTVGALIATVITTSKILKRQQASFTFRRKLVQKLRRINLDDAAIESVAPTPDRTQLIRFLGKHIGDDRESGWSWFHKRLWPEWLFRNAIFLSFPVLLFAIYAMLAATVAAIEPLSEDSIQSRARLMNLITVSFLFAIVIFAESIYYMDWIRHSPLELEQRPVSLFSHWKTTQLIGLFRIVTVILIASPVLAMFVYLQGWQLMLLAMLGAVCALIFMFGNLWITRVVLERVSFFPAALRESEPLFLLLGLYVFLMVLVAIGLSSLTDPERQPSFFAFWLAAPLASLLVPVAALAMKAWTEQPLGEDSFV